MTAPSQKHTDRASAYFDRVRVTGDGIHDRDTLAAEFAAVEREAIERAAQMALQVRDEPCSDITGKDWCLGYGFAANKIGLLLRRTLADTPEKTP